MGTTVWELDFYSRPIVDAAGKKVWEVAICESPLSANRTPETLFYFAKYCPAQTVNSVFLREAILEAIAQAPAPPKRIRFFRRQMNNMIVKACDDLGIPVAPSRRTYTLDAWLEHRLSEVYPQEPGYSADAVASASVQYPMGDARPLPDAVRGDRGDRWTFASLAAAEFDEMDEWDIAFGESFPLEIDPETIVPGTIVYSPRALPLAGWLSGLELVALHAQDISPARLLLETGIGDRWIFADLGRDRFRSEARKFATAKTAAAGVHFLAIQSEDSPEAFAGFWLLKG
ncbi:protein of unknown function (DUF1092) [Rubidibacter lacunae KORDI 51-2]|uniref:DUF1092 family protein n=1 Tax=Rubidibacter lacunae KORDI 51-2 TaxID=582515 RepID=U5D7N9_9CHRO|nr:Tab2/Atab2 family RNA-binding protein [Rubidibacter lacunae]ERN40618.1 protein of unknown function (DUF1092) [Rubidibacter lacunae KORDI 51-2]